MFHDFVLMNAIVRATVRNAKRFFACQFLSRARVISFLTRSGLASLKYLTLRRRELAAGVTSTTEADTPPPLQQSTP